LEQRIELDRLLKEAKITHDDLEQQYEQYKNYEKRLMDEAKEKANQRVKSCSSTRFEFFSRDSIIELISCSSVPIMVLALLIIPKIQN
jgi:dsDNA-specific endonuclease/ATPase MutS2